MKIAAKYEYTPVRPVDRLYSRSEVAELAQLPEEVIAFWGREAILVHAEGGEGRGSHKKYDFAQVNIAAVLASLRRQFSPKTEVLQSLANRLQAGVRLLNESKLYYMNASYAAALATKLAAFARGEEVEIYDASLTDHLPLREQIGISSRRPAADQLEIVAEVCGHLDYDSPSDVLAAARRIGPGQDDKIRMGEVIVGTFLKASDLDNVSWIVRPVNDTWEMLEISEGGTVDLTIREAAFYIPVGSIIADTWGEDWIAAQQKSDP